MEPINFLALPPSPPPPFLSKIHHENNFEVEFSLSDFNSKNKSEKLKKDKIIPVSKAISFTQLRPKQLNKYQKKVDKNNIWKYRDYF